MKTFAGDKPVPGERLRYAPQALGFSAGLSLAPQAAGLSEAPQAAGLSEAPQADPQAEAGAVSPILFQLDRSESAIKVDLRKMDSAGSLAPCAFDYTPFLPFRKYALFHTDTHLLVTFAHKS
jgi:hypothetical protein